MSTVYSLVCWGGKDGKTVTMTIASPCVVSLANHGLRDGAGVVFSTTGVQVKGWEAFTPSSSSHIIEITGAENTIMNPELTQETMTVTVRWTYGTGSNGTESFEYVIKNLRCSP